MFGQVTAYLFRYLLGMRTLNGALTVEPVKHKTVLSAEGTLTTRFGKITVKRETTHAVDKITIHSEKETALIYGEKEFVVPSKKIVTFVFTND